MFRAIILPILRGARLCVTACGIMHPRCCRPATSWVHYTTSCNTQCSAPEDGQNNCLKHVELTGNINILLFLHLFSCLFYLHCVLYFCEKQMQLVRRNYHHHHHHHHHRLYNPGWTLASSSKCHHRPQSWASASQFLQPSLFRVLSRRSLYTLIVSCRIHPASFP